MPEINPFYSVLYCLFGAAGTTPMAVDLDIKEAKSMCEALNRECRDVYSWFSVEITTDTDRRNYKKNIERASKDQNKNFEKFYDTTI